MLLCALCSPEGEIVGSASHAPTIPKGKAIAELVAYALPLPQSPSGAPGDPLQQLKEGPILTLRACSRRPTQYNWFTLPSPHPRPSGINGPPYAINEPLGL